MVSFNYLLSVAVAVVGAAPGILATTLVAAVDQPDIITFDTPTKRSIAEKFGKRHPAGEVDPYKGYQCASWYPVKNVLQNPTCHENNCYRAFLNARKGSDGFHCPSTAFDYCCQWYSLTSGDKKLVVKQGVLYHFLPWTANCGAAGPFHTDAEVLTVVNKVDDVCACTLKHKVKVTLPNDYAVLTPKKLSDPVCRQDL